MSEAQKDGALGEGLTDRDVQRTFDALAWLADAPLFIDRELVAAFYDAVVQPEGHRNKIVLSFEKYKDHRVDLRGSVKAKISPSKLLKLVFPWINAEVEAGIEAGVQTQRGQREGETVEIHPIETPQRQLVQLAFHYVANITERLVIVGEDEFKAEAKWYTKVDMLGLPRALVFMDFPPETKFIPMAAEVGSGLIVTVFNRLETKREKPPAAPERSPRECDKDWALRKDAAWDEYWGWFADKFNPQVALDAVEAIVSQQGRIQWIDYRVPLPDQRPIHIHVCGRGQFDTGTFAYNLIKRGFNHGLRVVGTLKSEPDLNVLAIFEK